MSDEQQSEEMRPIPDGGLKDAMPGWLKRPPAWRSMPTAQERHERALPTPDTSEIDPSTLVDVSDLPQWLQTIAARGDIPVPEPDESVSHALQQIKAVTKASSPGPQEVEVPEGAPEPLASSPSEPGSVKTVTPPVQPEMGLMSDEPAGVETSSPGARRPPLFVWALLAFVIILIVVGLAILASI